jgi:hypothetical protein
MVWVLIIERFAVSPQNEGFSQKAVPGPNDAAVPTIESDQTVAPRPEEEIADLLRAKPDVEDHSQHRD